ncbi:MAG TPA: riboflavin synthase [Gammaproteobacteria bacterium]|nr:riboflavin synthase [Gammaproteobacteria bacterium]
MFTGIIQAVGEIRTLEQCAGDARLTIAVGQLDMGDVALGDSIAVNGVCLTAVSLDTHSFVADVSAETLACTTLSGLSPGARVNLEKALMPTTRLGGHWVSGHVDGVGEVLRCWPDARSKRFRLRAPAGLAKYIAEKGSICVDGISLTVNRVEVAEFELNIVPHTLLETTMGDFKAGRRVNLEVDIIARYLERLLLGEQAAAPDGVSEALLAEHGFIKP